MAVINAIAGGNYSATSTWTDGVVPTTGDIASCGTFRIILDIDPLAVLSDTNTDWIAGGGTTLPTAHTGGFTIPDGATVNILAGIRYGFIRAGSISATNNSLYITNGNITIGTCTYVEGTVSYKSIFYISPTTTLNLSVSRVELPSAIISGSKVFELRASTSAITTYTFGNIVPISGSTTIGAQLLGTSSETGMAILAKDIRSGVTDGNTTGTLVVPQAANVLTGIVYDNGTVGTLSSLIDYTSRFNNLDTAVAVIPTLSYSTQFDNLANILSGNGYTGYVLDSNWGNVTIHLDVADISNILTQDGTLAGLPTGLTVSNSVMFRNRGSIACTLTSRFNVTGSDNATVLGTNGDFTAELYFNAASVPSLSNNISVLVCIPTGMNLEIRHDGKIGLWLANSGDSSAYYTSTVTYDLATWYHLALVRSGDSFKVYLNGKNIISVVYPGYALPNTSIVLCNAWWNNSLGLDGYVRDITITKNVTRYTTEFSIPTVCYPLSQIGTVSGDHTIAARVAQLSAETDQLATNTTEIKTNATAIKAKTDLLTFTANGVVADATGSQVTINVQPVLDAVADVQTGVTAIQSNTSGLSTTLSSVKTKTDQLTFSNGVITTTDYTNRFDTLDTSVAAIPTTSYTSKLDAIKAKTDTIIDPTSSLSAITATLSDIESALTIIENTTSKIGFETIYSEGDPNLVLVTFKAEFNNGTKDSDTGQVSHDLYGTPVYTTAAQRTGSGSLSLPNSAVYYNHYPEIFFGALDFTIELSVMFSTLPVTNDYAGVIGKSWNSSNFEWILFLYNGALVFITSGDGAVNIVHTQQISAGVWYDIAISKTSGTLKMFINGVVNEAACPGMSITDSSAPLMAGRLSYDVSSYHMNGIIDRIRITKGIGRYSTIDPVSPAVNVYPTTTTEVAESYKVIANCDSGATIPTDLVDRLTDLRNRINAVHFVVKE